LELGKKPPQAAVTVATNGRGLGRGDAKMEWREAELVNRVSNTTTGGSTHAHP
jgi:hypothetical protein